MDAMDGSVSLPRQERALALDSQQMPPGVPCIVGNAARQAPGWIHPIRQDIPIVPRVWLGISLDALLRIMAARLVGLGFTGIVTLKNALELQTVAKATPLDRILLETDGPYLEPVPHRGRPAHPGHIPLIAQKIAELKGEDVEDVYGGAGEYKRIYRI